MCYSLFNSAIFYPVNVFSEHSSSTAVEPTKNVKLDKLTITNVNVWIRSHQHQSDTPKTGI